MEGETASGAHSHTHTAPGSPLSASAGAAVSPSKLSRRPPRPPLEAPQTEYLCSRVDLQSSERKRAQQPEVWQRSACAPGAASSGPAPSLVDVTAAQGPAGWKEAGAQSAGLHSLSQAEPGWTRSDGTAGVGGEPKEVAQLRSAHRTAPWQGEPARRSGPCGLCSEIAPGALFSLRTREEPATSALHPQCHPCGSGGLSEGISGGYGPGWVHSTHAHSRDQGACPQVYIQVSETGQSRGDMRPLSPIRSWGCTQ